MLNERKLKVYSATRTSNNSNSWRNTIYYDVPQIVLSGKWLEAAGFSIADNIIVTIEDNKLIITKDLSIPDNHRTP